MGKARVEHGIPTKRPRGRGAGAYVRITKKDWNEESITIDQGMVFVDAQTIIPFTKEEAVGKEIFIYFVASEDSETGEQGILDRGTIKEVDVQRRSDDPDNPRPMHLIQYHREEEDDGWEDLSRCMVFWRDDVKGYLLTSDKSLWRDDEGVEWPPAEPEAAPEEKQKHEEKKEAPGRGGRRGRGNQAAAEGTAQPEQRRRGRRGGDVTPPQEKGPAATAAPEETTEGEETAPVAEEAPGEAAAAPATKPEASAPGSGAAAMEVEDVDITGNEARPGSAPTAPGAAAPAPAPAEPAAEPTAPVPAAPAPEAAAEKAPPAAEAAAVAPEEKSAAAEAELVAPAPPSAPAAPGGGVPPAAEAAKRKRKAEEAPPAAGTSAAAAAAATGPSKRQATAQPGAKPQKPQDRERQQQPKQQQAQRQKQGPGAAGAPAAGGSRLPAVPKTLKEKAERLDKLREKRETLLNQLDLVNREAAAIGADLRAHPVKAKQASEAGLPKAVNFFVSEAINPARATSLERRDSWITAPAGDLRAVLNAWLKEENRKPLTLGPKVAAWMAPAAAPAPAPAPASAPPEKPSAPPAPAAAAPPASQAATAAAAEEEGDALPFPSTGDESRDDAIVVLAHALVTATSAVDAAREMETALFAKYVVSAGEKEVNDGYLTRVKRVWEVLSPRSAGCRPAIRFALLSGVITPSELVMASAEFLAQTEAAVVQECTKPQEGWLADMLRTVQLPHRTAPPGVMVMPPGQVPPAIAGPSAAVAAAPAPVPAAAPEDMDLGE